MIVDIIVTDNVLTIVNIIMIFNIIKIIVVIMIFNFIINILDVLSGQITYSIKIISESVVHFLIVPLLLKVAN